MYTIYVNNTLPPALAVHEIYREIFGPPRPKKKYVCFLFHPVKSLGRVGRLSFFFFNFFYNLILTTNIQHIKVAHNFGAPFRD